MHIFKRIKIALLVAYAVMLVSCITSCQRMQPQENGFVYIEDGVFKIKGETFYPLMLNYKAEILDFEDGLVFAAAKYYDSLDIYEPKTKQEALEQYSGHMQLIEDLGFNTVRLCFNVILSGDEGYYYKTPTSRLFLKRDYKRIIDAVEEMVSIAAQHNLKVMLLLKPSWDDELSWFNGKIMSRLAQNEAVFAFDLMNEPLYFDIVTDRAKSDAVKIVTKWVNNARKNAPNHLVTIGFVEPIEVFGWDPSVMPLDFIEVHTYNPLSVPNEIWWYSHYVGKPWMIGETALPADNDSVSYEQQKYFAEQVTQYVVDCGGIGFGWWEFQDVPESYQINYEGTYSGILNHVGTTTASDGHVIQGTLKPVAYTFANFKDLKKGTPKQSVNYYNNFGYHNAVITGRIVDYKTGKPIEGAAVRGWNQWWRVGLNTSTNEDGVFNLYSNDECVHFAISAPGKETKRFDMSLEYRDKNGVISDFSSFTDRKVKSSMVSFGLYLKDQNNLFDFKEDEFDKAVIFADMGEIKLKDF